MRLLGALVMGLAGLVPADIRAPGQTPTTTPTPTPTATPNSGHLAIDPQAAHFGEVTLGGTGTVRVTLTAEDGPVQLRGASFVDVPTAFGLVGESCLQKTLGSGNTCKFNLTFHPSNTGFESNTLKISTDAASYTMALDGTGIGSAQTTTTVPTTSQSSSPATTKPAPSTSPATTKPPPTSSADTTEPPSTSPSSTTSSAPETLERCDMRALEAELHYAPKIEMVIGTAEDVTVVATIGPTPPPSTSVPDEPSTTVVPQPLRCQVKARLVANDFDITPDDWDTKSFLGRSEVSWLWSVSPNKAGEHQSLIVEVQGLRLDENTHEYVEAGESFTKSAHINVDVESIGFWERVNRAVSGFVTHPLIAFVAGLGVFAGADKLLPWARKRARTAWNWLKRRF